MSKLTELRQQAAREATAARHIVEKAAGREMTANEKTTFDQHYREALRLKAKADTTEKDQSVLDQAQALAREVGDPIGGPVSGKTSYGRITSPWAQAASAKLAEKAGRVGIKALVSGSIDVAAPLSPGIAEVPDFPRRLIDLVLDREAISGNVFTFVQQTARTSNAAPVADGQVKPTSNYTFEEVEDRARVVAHIVEGIPERLLADHANLERLLSDELEADLVREVEDQIVAGDGVGENFPGLLSTSGTVAVPFFADLLSTCRRARTVLDDLGEVPTAWCFNSADLEAIDLMRENTGGANTGGFMVNTSTLDNVFGSGLPRIGVPSLPPGQAILGDFRQCRLVVREDARIDADRSGDNFKANVVDVRCEGRYNVAVLRPQAFAVLDLTAA